MGVALFKLSSPVPPLFIIEFLHRIIDIFTQYFTECTEQRIKDHYVIVYEVNPRPLMGVAGYAVLGVV